MGFPRALLDAPLFASLALAASVGVVQGQRSSAEGGVVLDVPYVPQSEDMCGAAAVTMVFRYWGATDVRMSDFEPLVARDGSGIAASDLHRAVSGMGWETVSFAGDLKAISDQLSRGRPVIALIAVGGGRFHYVTVVGLLENAVVFHDPAISPYQRTDTRDFEREWAESGYWTLLVLPPEGDSTRADALGDEPAPATAWTADDDGACGPSVAEGVALARAGDGMAARRVLTAAATACPASAAPPRELAALELKEGRAEEAVPLARRAVELGPGDRHAWELLAASYYLTGDDVVALDAWNRVAPVVVDGVTVGGPSRTRQTSILGLAGARPDQILTANALRLGRRRLALLPAATSTRLDYRPLGDGHVEVTAAVAERPLIGGVTQLLVQQAAGVLGDRGLDLRLASPLGAGELWTAGFRWPEPRRRFAFSLILPVGTPVGGTVRIGTVLATETYAFQAETREDRRLTEVAFETWLTPRLRTSTSVALDRWADRGRYASLGADVLVVLWDDRATLRVEGAGWSGASSFARGSAEVRLVSSERRHGPVLSGRLGVSGATAAAPYMLWPGAGTGFGRPTLARAHPMLTDGRFNGSLFGRSLLHGGLEVVWWTGWGPLDLGAAAFSDLAVAEKRPEPFQGTDAQVDVGVGIRIGLLGQHAARLDVAHGLRDAAFAVSAGMEVAVGSR